MKTTDFQPSRKVRDEAHRISASSGRAVGAFTLVEMLVAVGAIALVSVGLAAIFQTVGRTVTTGKRVSALTQQAAILESQMREDFKNMTRDGFLVIRHQFAIGNSNDSPAPIAVSRFAGDPVAARVRRVDEILFFATGEYRTAREDLIPGRTAKSRAARIYYGHGQKAEVRTPEFERDNKTDVHYYTPYFSDFFTYATTSRLGENRQTGVNRYASTWNLVRHATLLVRPSTAAGAWPLDRPRPNYSGDGYSAQGVPLNNLSMDSAYQAAGQPVAASVFNNINEMLPMVDPAGGGAPRAFSMFWDKSPLNAMGTTPRFNSGVVDLASTDLDEISMVVNGSFYGPGDSNMVSGGGALFFGDRSIAGIGVLEPVVPFTKGPWLDKVIVNKIQKKVDPAFYPSAYVVSTIQNNASALNTTTARMQAWMVDAMPTPSAYHPTLQKHDQDSVNISNGLKGQIGFRIRCEDDIPDIRGTLDGPTGRAVQTQRTDLLTVGLSKIASRCSEFIVEWSWGQTYPSNLPNVQDPVTNKTVNFSNQTIWYGGTTINAGGKRGVYHYQLQNSLEKYPQFPDNLQGQIDLSYKPFKGITEYAGVTKVQDYVVPEMLVHGVRKHFKSPNGPVPDDSSLVSYFGYFDPLYTQKNATEPPSLPWAWPKMVRVTFTLSDASDPSIEQTFQYVFDLPPDSKP